MRENADEKRLDEIENALQPPRTMKHGGVPMWYGSDDDAWAQFDVEMRKKA